MSEVQCTIAKLSLSCHKSQYLNLNILAGLLSYFKTNLFHSSGQRKNFKIGCESTSVATNNSLFEYSNNRRPNNDIRIRIRSILKI